MSEVKSVPISPPMTVMNRLFELLMLALLAFTPLAFGSVEAWSQEVLFLLVAGLVVCFGCQLFFSRDERIEWSWSLVPTGLFLIWCLLQLVPFSRHVMELISPHTVLLRNELLSDVSKRWENGTRITFYTSATIEQLRLLGSLVLVFVVVLGYYRTADRIIRLLFMIASVALVVAGLALYQNMADPTTIFGVAPVMQPDSGPFMCHSHFAQFMNLSLGAAAGLLLVKWNEAWRRQHFLGDIFETMREPRSWMIWVLALVCVVVPIAMLLSLARMGAISLIAAAAVTTTLLIWKTKVAGRGSLVVGFVVLIFAGLLATGFDAVYSRLATVRQFDVAEGGRLQLLRDMSAEFKLFPLTGTGLGTHEFVFPMFDHSNIPELATHAENEYAQLLAECGLPGLLLAISFLIVVLYSYWKSIRALSQPVQYAAFGLGLGLFAILIHSASDFGQHVPANAVLTAISCALLINLSRIGSPKPDVSASNGVSVARREGMPRWFLAIPTRIAVALLVLALLAWGGWAGDRRRRAESAWNQACTIQATLESKSWQGSNQEFAELIAPAAVAADLAPGNVTYRYWLNVFRWRCISRISDVKTHAIVLSPRNVEFAERIAKELESLRPLCPTYGPPLCVAGQIEDFVLHQPEGARHIVLAEQLTPYDRTVCLIAGKLCIAQKEWDTALRTFQQYVNLGGDRNEAIDCFIATARPDLALKLAAGNRQALSYLADHLSDPADHAICEQSRAQSLSLLLAEAQAPGASADAMAELAERYAAAHQDADAALWYQKALSANYGQVEWRLSLAKVLADAGRVSEAMEQARICERLRPQSEQARTLIADLSIRSNADVPASDSNATVASPLR